MLTTYLSLLGARITGKSRDGWVEISLVALSQSSEEPTQHISASNLDGKIILVSKDAECMLFYVKF